MAVRISKQDAAKLGAVKGVPKFGKAKYGNRPEVYQGIRFDSQAELARWKVLEAKLAAGVIKFLYPHPRFRLGVPENVYVADSLVVDADGCVRVEDVKGSETAKFRKDRRLWKAYGQCDLWVIKGKKVEVITPERGA